jgi:hypothetical protein
VVARFRSTRRGPSANLAAGEAVLLGVLLADLLTLLAGDEETDSESEQADPLEVITGMSDAHQSGVVPDDPVLARLLPDAYADDPERAAEFRRYTEDELRAAKRTAARAVLESLPAEGGKVVLDAALTDAWLGALNDLRLALGTRLEVTEDSYKELEGMDPTTRRARELNVFLWLGYLQETLVDTQF